MKPQHKQASAVGLPHLEKPVADFPHEDMIELSNTLLEYYGLAIDTEVEDKFGFLISYSEEGHIVHKHKDFNKDNSIHCRINMLISKPNEGGNPVIEGQELQMEENEVWMCLAGLQHHGTTEVHGSKPRILISLGYYIPRNILEEKGWI